MLQAFSILKSSVTSSRRSTESYVFYLHYRITFLLLMLACLLISSRQFVGDKIKCLSAQPGEITIGLLEAYCWAASTYSVSSAYLKEVGVEVPHPGIGGSESDDEYTFRNYYQYIHIVLFFQALLFYLPHLIWKSADKTYMDSMYSSIELCKEENNKPEKIKDPSFDIVASFLEERWGTHLFYGIHYIFCEFLSIVNLIIQSFLLDVFFSGEFFRLGYFYISHYNAERQRDPIQLFPLVTNCYFKKFGASGFVDTVDALCVLPINALNVKIYLFIWAWFSSLAGVSICSLLHFSLAWLFPRYRVLPLKLKSILFKSRMDQDSYIRILMLGDFGDWFVLSCLKNNMDSLEFSRLMETLHNKLSNLGTETKEA